MSVTTTTARAKPGLRPLLVAAAMLVLLAAMALDTRVVRLGAPNFAQPSAFSPDMIGVISGNDEMALGAIAALKEAGKLSSVKVGGFDGSPDAIAAVKAGELQYTVLQPVAIFSAKAVQEADAFLNSGKTGSATEKQLFDCTLITTANADRMSAPFTME